MSKKLPKPPPPPPKRIFRTRFFGGYAETKSSIRAREDYETYMHDDSGWNHYAYHIVGS